MTSLDVQLLDAHDRNDTEALVGLYVRAADASADDEAIGFYLTHAYVYALETGHPDGPALRARLVELGREEPLQDPSDSWV